MCNMCQQGRQKTLGKRGCLIFVVVIYPGNENKTKVNCTILVSMDCSRYKQIKGALGQFSEYPGSHIPTECPMV